MKVKIDKSLVEAIGVMSPLGVVTLPLSVPFAVMATLMTGLTIYRPSNEYYEIEVNPFDGMADEVFQKQYQEWIAGLWQAALYGVKERKSTAINALKALNLYNHPT